MMFTISCDGENGCAFLEDAHFEYSVLDSGWTGWSEIRIYLGDDETRELFIAREKLIQ